MTMKFLYDLTDFANTLHFVLNKDWQDYDNATQILISWYKTAGVSMFYHHVSVLYKLNDSCRRRRRSFNWTKHSLLIIKLETKHFLFYSSWLLGHITFLDECFHVWNTKHIKIKICQESYSILTWIERHLFWLLVMKKIQLINDVENWRQDSWGLLSCLKTILDKTSSFADNNQHLQ